MIKKISIIVISIFIISCNSSFNSNSTKGPKFMNRSGIYKNADSTITVTIKNTNKDNLIIDITNPSSINETLSVNPYSTRKYIVINSKQYAGYVYSITFLMNTDSMFISITDDKDTDIISNEKLTIQK